MFIEVKVGALIMDPNNNTPIVVLRGINDDAILPIWVGAYEANAIALEIEKIVPQIPMTHDMLRNTIIEMGFQVEKIVVNDLIENTFYALIEISNKSGGIFSLDSRPSDAIALALRTDCPIFVDTKIIQISNSSTALTTNVETIDNTNRGSFEEWPDLIG